MKEIYISKLEKLTKKALQHEEVPVGALIIKNNKIIAKAYNKRNKKKNPILHAEIIAIQKASKKLKDWRLNECDLYVTLKPCKMCESIIKESRINNVYYLLENEKKVHYKTKFNKINCKFNDKYKQMLENFFLRKR